MQNDATQESELEVKAESIDQATPTPDSTEEISTAPVKTNSSEKEARFKDGEEIELVRVRFPGNAKSHPFIVGKRKFSYAQKVVAMSDRGMSVGYINSFPYKVKYKDSMKGYKTIAKVATDEDILEQRTNIKRELEAETACKRLVEKHKLDMNITHVEFMQFGKKAVFYFTAPARIDFRQLVKELVGDIKMRIELRQISVRDRTAALGAIGACGLQTCCSSFLKNYGNTSIKLAKNQNLALIPSKINGVCGQIKCCMKFEDEVYSEKRKRLPREGSYIKVKNGDIGKVLKLHILNEQFNMLTDKGEKRRYAINQYDSKNAAPAKEWKFPERFNHIVDESSELIGAVDKSEKLKEEHEQHMASFGATPLMDTREEEVEAKSEESPAVELKDSQDSKAAKKSGNRNRNRNRNRNAKAQSSAPKGEDKSQKDSTAKKNVEAKGPGHKENKPRSNNRNRNRNRNKNTQKKAPSNES